MADENAKRAYDGEKNAQPSLLNLPMEIFLHICSFLDTSTLVHGLSLVCTQFRLFLKDDFLWKARINHIWPNATHSLWRPARPDKLFWMSSCVAIEKQTALWKEHDYMETNLQEDPERYCSHTRKTLLMHVDGTTCVVNAVDHNLVYWKLPPCEDLPFGDGITNPDYISSKDTGSWIYDLTAIDNTIYSISSGRRIIKSWVLTNTGLVHQKNYKTTMLSEAKCISSCPERALFAIGSVLGEIRVFDSRSSNKPISRYRSHITEVTNLAMNAEYILSASQDNTVSIWDQRAEQTMKFITIPSYASPCYISMRRDWVCVADDAKFHMLSPNDNFKIVKSYSHGHRRTQGTFEHPLFITGLYLSHGCLIRSFTDGTVKISSPTDPPKLITTLRPKFDTIDNLDYLNGTLAVSDYNGNIAVWRPKSTG